MREESSLRFVRAAARQNVPPGGCIAVRLGSVFVALADVAGEIHALDNRCPHRGGPLGMGEMDGEWIICPYHHWAFSVTRGVWDNDADRRLRTFPVRLEGEAILIGLDDDEIPAADAPIQIYDPRSGEGGAGG